MVVVIMGDAGDTITEEEEDEKVRMALRALLTTR